MVSKVHFSSQKSEWETPPFLYHWLDGMFNFDLDPAASDKNHKCDIYFTKEEDGLKRDWKIVADSVFLNPPYGRRITYQWMKKAYTEARRGIDVVCLVAGRSDNDWWHHFCMKSNERWDIHHRIYFLDETGKSAPAPFPSVIILFLGRTHKLPSRPILRGVEINRKTKEITLI